MNIKSVCVYFPWFSLFASGFGMKGLGGLVREEQADVSWPVGTWFSRIKLPSQGSFGPTLTRSHSVSCLSPIPLPSLITPISLSASVCEFVSWYCFGTNSSLILKLPGQLLLMYYPTDLEQLHTKLQIVSIILCDMQVIIVHSFT